MAATERSLAWGYGPRQPQKTFQIVAVPFLSAGIDYINIVILESMPKQSTGRLPCSYRCIFLRVFFCVTQFLIPFDKIKHNIDIWKLCSVYCQSWTFSLFSFLLIWCGGQHQNGSPILWERACLTTCPKNKKSWEKASLTRNTRYRKWLRTRGYDRKNDIELNWSLNP